jgi:hypothetical protein
MPRDETKATQKIMNQFQVSRLTEEICMGFFRCAYLLTYLRRWALPEKLPIVELFKNFLAFY